MNTPRISASSYSNTAPLVWSFLYGKDHGSVEIILDNAPARSAELLSEGRVDAALVPVIAYQMMDGVRLVPDVCVGATEKVRSVSLITKGKELKEVRSVSLDVSSRTSAALTKIIFREFIGFQPQWNDAVPHLEAMLAASDAALIIGDPALSVAERRARDAGYEGIEFRVFDLVELWRSFTGLGFVFAMWMTRGERAPIDFAAARDEGLAHLEEIAANYTGMTGLPHAEMLTYLSRNISYSVDDSMEEGMKLYFELAEKNALIRSRRPLAYAF